MQLTPYQYARLKQSQRFHAEGVTGPILVIRHWRFWLVMLLLALLVHFLFASVTPYLAWIGMGVCIGAMLRELGHIRHIIRIWPVSNEITSWEKVSELIEAHDRQQESFRMLR